MLMEKVMDFRKVLMSWGEKMEYLRAKSWLESSWDDQWVLM